MKKFLLLTTEDHTKIAAQLRGNSLWSSYVHLANDTEPLRIFLNIYEPFCEAIRTLEADKTPTLHLVIPVICKLENHFNECSTSESELQANLSKSVLAVLQYKKAALITDEHGIALCLDPLNKAQAYYLLGAEKFGDIKRKFEEHVKAVVLDTAPDVQSFNPFTQLTDRTQSPEASTELNQYYTENINPTDYNITKWWQDNGHRFPRIAKVAKKILCIPASSASIERLFSTLKNMTPAERSSIKSETLTELVLYKSLSLANLL